MGRCVAHAPYCALVSLHIAAASADAGGRQPKRNKFLSLGIWREMLQTDELDMNTGFWGVFPNADIGAGINLLTKPGAQNREHKDTFDAFKGKLQTYLGVNAKWTKAYNNTNFPDIPVENRLPPTKDGVYIPDKSHRWSKAYYEHGLGRGEIEQYLKDAEYAELEKARANMTKENFQNLVDKTIKKKREPPPGWLAFAVIKVFETETGKTELFVDADLLSFTTHGNIAGKISSEVVYYGPRLDDLRGSQGSENGPYPVSSVWSKNNTVPLAWKAFWGINKNADSVRAKRATQPKSKSTDAGFQTMAQGNPQREFENTDENFEAMVSLADKKIKEASTLLKRITGAYSSSSSAADATRAGMDVV